MLLKVLFLFFFGGGDFLFEVLPSFVSGSDIKSTRLNSCEMYMFNSTYHLDLLICKLYICIALNKLSICLSIYF